MSAKLAELSRDVVKVHPNLNVFALAPIARDRSVETVGSVTTSRDTEALVGG